MDINEMARKLAKELVKDQELKGKTFVFLEDKLDVLNELNDEFANILDRWDEKYESLSERMQQSSRGEEIGGICDCLNDICGNFNDLVVLIEDLKNTLSNTLSEEF